MRTCLFQEAPASSENGSFIGVGTSRDHVGGVLQHSANLGDPSCVVLYPFRLAPTTKYDFEDRSLLQMVLSSVNTKPKPIAAGKTGD